MTGITPHGDAGRDREPDLSSGAVLGPELLSRSFCRLWVPGWSPAPWVPADPDTLRRVHAALKRLLLHEACSYGQTSSRVLEYLCYLIKAGCHALRVHPAQVRPGDRGAAAAHRVRRVPARLAAAERAPAQRGVPDRPPDRGPGAAGAAPGRVDRDPAGQGQLRARRPGEQALNRDESREPGELAGTGMSVPPPRVATLLGAPAETKVPYRRLLLRRDGEASEIVTWWVPVPVAEGTDLATPEPLHGGVRPHLARRKGIRIDHVIEQVVARHPTAQEARLLGVTRTAPMLAMYVAARDASGGPVLVLELVMPGDRHELEDAYQVG